LDISRVEHALDCHGYVVGQLLLSRILSCRVIERIRVIDILVVAK
jgi:hypothetical protein